MRIFSLTTLAIASLALGGTAQEFILPLGFASNAGSPTDDVPVARLKDNNLNGSITPGVEMASFMNFFGSAANTRTSYPSPMNFMTDGVWVIENNEPAFYFTDTEEGRVIRCVDTNHNGFIDSTEWTVFFNFGLSTTTSATTNSNGLFAPDSVAAWRDTANNRTIVYAAIDNGSASTRGYTHGIYRLIDQNGNGTAMDTGVDYAAAFVNSTMGLTVPGRTGPVTISRDFWSKIRCAPGGKLLAFASGSMLSGPPYTVQPEMNAWYGFTDNNGTATAEVWLNMSSLNDLPMHPDFSDPRVPSNGLFPNMDIQEPAPGTRRMHFGGFLGIAPGAGPGGLNVYIVACSYNSGPGFFDTNLNNQLIAGLFYRVVDFNGNQRIDAGELSLFCNISNATYNNVAPISFVNPATFLTHNQLTGRQWGFDATTDGSAGFSYVFSSSQTAFLTFRDNNGDFVIDSSELTVPVVIQQTGSSPYPFDQQLGPFLASNPMLPDGLMPGPFATTAAAGNGTVGITPLGDGCVLQANHLKVLMDTWFGNPQVGNTNFKLGAIRVPAGQPAFLVADFLTRSTPMPLAPLGLGAGCFGYLQNPTTVGFAAADTKGRAMLVVPIPNTTTLAGLNVFFQCAVLDTTIPQPVVPFYTTNALQVTVQP